MRPDPDSWKRQRMKTLAAKLGGNVALGKLLEHQNGAQVGHMIAGRRPITDKTIEKAEAIKDSRLPGGSAAGWFSVAPPEGEEDDFEPPPPTLEQAADIFASALAGVPPVGREAIAGMLSTLARSPEQAATLVPAMLQFMQSVSPPPSPTPHKPAESRKKTTAKATSRPPGKAHLVLKIGGGNKQQFDLPLRRSAFKKETATPRELEWYQQVKAAPKADD